MSAGETAPDAASPFVAGAPVKIAVASNGPLPGLIVAAKNLFDVAGCPTGGT